MEEERTVPRFPKSNKNKTRKNTKSKRNRTLKNFMKRLNNNKKAVVAFGRYQPPHSGHLGLINELLNVKDGTGHLSFYTRSSGPINLKWTPIISVFGEPQIWGKNPDQNNFEKNPLEVYKKMTYLYLMLPEDRADEYTFMTPYKISNKWMESNSNKSESDKSKYSNIFNNLNRLPYKSKRTKSTYDKETDSFEKSNITKQIYNNIEFAVDILKSLDYEYITLIVGNEDQKYYDSNKVKNMGKNVCVKTLGEIRKKESVSDDRISGSSLRELAKDIYNDGNWNIENLNKWFGATIPENSRMSKRDSLNLLNDVLSGLNETLIPEEEITSFLGRRPMGEEIATGNIAIETLRLPSILRGGKVRKQKRKRKITRRNQKITRRNQKITRIKQKNKKRGRKQKRKTIKRRRNK